MMMSDPKADPKIALIRLDKIGDLVCTLPADQTLRELYPRVNPWWIISQGLGFIAANAEPGRRFLQINKISPWMSFFILWRFFRKEKIDLIISFQAPWWVHFAALLARVPQRIGVYSQWHSYLFLTKGLRQKRSRSEKHELVYNCELVRYALTLNDPSSGAELSVRTHPKLKLRPPVSVDFIERIGLKDKSYIVVHPGMKGSAKNWSQKNYIELLHELNKNHFIVITGTPEDEAYLSEIRSAFQSEDRMRWLVGELSSTELLRILSGAKFVVAPSTGVAHLAASLNTPVFALFPSAPPSQTAQRWAPLGENVTLINEPTPSSSEFLQIQPREVFRAIEQSYEENYEA